MNWNELSSMATLEEIKSKSFTQPVVIYKHSTRCSISSMALNRLERSWNAQEMEGTTIYFLDLIAHRDISNEIAQLFDVQHESPQVLLISGGECVYHASHMGISYRELKGQLGKDQLAV
ncbi:MAG: bacillithiol system redox-active protein YtxJ [Cyclobacteriaceae bacterium]